MPLTAEQQGEIQAHVNREMAELSPFITEELLPNALEILNLTVALPERLSSRSDLRFLIHAREAFFNSALILFGYEEGEGVRLVNASVSTCIQQFLTRVMQQRQQSKSTPPRRASGAIVPPSPPAAAAAAPTRSPPRTVAISSGVGNSPPLSDDEIRMRQIINTEILRYLNPLRIHSLEERDQVVLELRSLMDKGIDVRGVKGDIKKALNGLRDYFDPDLFFITESNQGLANSLLQTQIEALSRLDESGIAVRLAQQESNTQDYEKNAHRDGEALALAGSPPILQNNFQQSKMVYALVMPLPQGFMVFDRPQNYDQVCQSMAFLSREFTRAVLREQRERLKQRMESLLNHYIDHADDLLNAEAGISMASSASKDITRRPVDDLWWALHSLAIPRGPLSCLYHPQGKWSALFSLPGASSTLVRMRNKVETAARAQGVVPVAALGGSKKR